MDEDGIFAHQPRYAGFGRRVGAFGVDFLISSLLLLPIVIWGGSRFKYFPLYSLGPIASQFLHPLRDGLLLLSFSS